ncbi:hypothetical protein [Amycolatopsis sp. NPDC003676]
MREKKLDGPHSRQPPGAAGPVEEFPGAVVVAHESMGCGPVASVVRGTVNNDELLTLEVSYARLGRTVLVVKNVLSASAAAKPAFSIEDKGSQVVNFVKRADLADSPDEFRWRQGDACGDFAPAESAMAYFQRIQDIVRRAPATEKAVSIDDETLIGTRTDIIGCAVVEVRRADRHVFCTGQPDLIDVLELRTAAPSEFTHLGGE